MESLYTADERAAPGHAALGLDETTIDIFLSDIAYRRNFPAAI